VIQQILAIIFSKRSLSVGSVVFWSLISIEDQIIYNLVLPFLSASVVIFDQLFELGLLLLLLSLLDPLLNLPECSFSFFF